MSKPRREMSPRRTAKSVRSHEKTMEAYGDAAQWGRIDTKAVESGVGTWFPRAKDNNRASGNVMAPRDSNPRSGIERQVGLDNPSERSILGHTIGKGHVSTVDSDGNRIRKAHTKDHPGHHWAPAKDGKMVKSKCSGCGASSVSHYRDLNNGQVGWK